MTSYPVPRELLPIYNPAVFDEEPIGSSSGSSSSDSDVDLFNRQINTSINSVLSNSFTSDLILDSKYLIRKSGTSSASVSNGLCTITNSTGIGDYILLRSRKNVKYRAGFVVENNNAIKFDTPTVNTIQFSGMGTASNDIYYGYNAAGDFVFRVSKSGRQEIRTLTITAAATGAENASLTLDGVLYTIPLINATGLTSFTAHEIEDWMKTNQTSWNITHIANTIIFASNTVGPRTGTYSFTSATAAGNIVQNQVGIALTTTETTLANFNGNSSAINNLNPQKVNMYQLSFAFYGAANIRLGVYNSSKQQYDVLHTYRFANEADALNLSDPNLYVQNIASDFGAGVSKSISVGGSYVGYTGPLVLNNYIGYTRANTKNISAGVETNILVIAHRDILNNRFCQNEIIISTISASGEGTKPITFRLYYDTDISPSYTTADYTNYQLVNAQSIALYDITSDTIDSSVGRLVFTATIGKSGNETYSLKDYDIFLGQGDTLVITAESTGAAEVVVSVNWSEDV